MLLTDHDLERATAAAGLLAEPSRARLLLELEPEPLSVNELAARLGLAQPRVSTQLAALRAAGWVGPEAQGRQRRYRLLAARVPDAIRALADAAPVAPVAARKAPLTRKPRPDEPARAARTCYDHLAGVAGVTLCAALLERGWLAPVAGRGQHQPDYALTDLGRRELAARGVALPAPGGRRLAYACPDWTEARPHVAGALGAALLDGLRAAGVVTTQPGTRLARVEGDLAGWLG
jgi:DNA-binding transcriptional ArsR family regulator